jgi:DNA-directed RNA polymerase specialized sigma24 family protein
MDTPLNTAPLNAQPQKRSQRFLKFKMQPGDEALLEQLNDNQRELLLAQGSYQELADRFGLPVVRSRLHRARAALIQLRDGTASDRPSLN